MEEKVQEIKVLKKEQEDLRMKRVEEIIELKKEQYRLVIEKAHLWDNHVKLEEAVADSCQHILERTTDIDVVEIPHHLETIISKLQSENNILETLVHLTIPPEKIAVRKSAIEYLATQLNEMEKEVKKVTDVTSQFQGSIVDDEQLAQLTTQLQEEEGDLATLKTSLRVMPMMVQITKSANLKEMHEWVEKERERNQ